MDNTCVCCGEIIPEGTQVCPKCSEGDTFAAVMRRKIPAAEFKVDDVIEQAFRQGYEAGKKAK